MSPFVTSNCFLLVTLCHLLLLVTFYLLQLVTCHFWSLVTFYNMWLIITCHLLPNIIFLLVIVCHLSLSVTCYFFLHFLSLWTFFFFCYFSFLKVHIFMVWTKKTYICYEKGHKNRGVMKTHTEIWTKVTHSFSIWKKTKKIFMKKNTWSCYEKGHTHMVWIRPHSEGTMKDTYI